MSEENTTTKTAWKKGQPSPNPAGRPRSRGVGKPISRLRSTLNKLKEREQLAVQIIDNVLEGHHENLSKDQIEMAKWVLARIESYTRSAIHEESFKMDVREKTQEGSAQSNGTTGTPYKPRLSLTIVSDDE